MRRILKYLSTGLIVLIAVAVFALKYWDFVTNPLTRNGQVFAQVVQITPRVSGPLIKLPVAENQFVKAGDLLFEIDRRTFEAALEQARAELDNTLDKIQALEKQVEAAQADVEAANATIKQSEAAIKAYAGRVEETRKEYNRQQTLDKQGATSKRAVETARANWVAACQPKSQCRGPAFADASVIERSQCEFGQSKSRSGCTGRTECTGAPGQSQSPNRGAESRIHPAKGAG